MKPVLILMMIRTCAVSCVRYAQTFYQTTDTTCKFRITTSESCHLFFTDTAINYNVIEANITILCAALIASKPVIMFLLPDSLMLRVRSCLNKSFNSLRSGFGRSHHDRRAPDNGVIRKASMQSGSLAGTTSVRSHESPPKMLLMELPFAGPTKEPFETPGHADTPHRIRGSAEGTNEA